MKLFWKWTATGFVDTAPSDTRWRGSCVCCYLLLAAVLCVVYSRTSAHSTRGLVIKWNIQTVVRRPSTSAVAGQSSALGGAASAFLTQKFCFVHLPLVRFPPFRSTSVSGSTMWSLLKQCITFCRRRIESNQLIDCVSVRDNQKFFRNISMAPVARLVLLSVLVAMTTVFGKFFFFWRKKK